MRFSFFRILGIGLFLFVLFAFPRSAFAIGISPSRVEVDNVTNNIEVKKTFFISRGNPARKEFFSVTPVGEGAKYLQLPEPPFVLNKGVPAESYTFSIKPVGAPNGTYEVLLVFNAMEDPTAPAGQNSVAISAGVLGKVIFTVTDKEIKGFSILNAYGQSTEVNQPASFYFTLQNTGNVDVRPDKIDYEFINESDPSDIHRGTISKESLAFVAPSQTEAVSFLVNEKLAEGAYVVSLTFYFQDQVVYTASNIKVTVYEEGTLKQKANVKSIKINKDYFEPGELVKFDGLIENNGDIAIQPMLQVEIEKDKKAIDILTSEKKALLKQQDSNFTVTFKPTEKGKYNARAYFEYGIYKSEAQVFEFQVGKPSMVIYIVIGISIFLILLLVLFLARKMLHKAPSTETKD